MRLLKVAAAALNQTPLDWAGNRRRILAAIDDARRQHVSVLCLPELCISGYGCEDAFHSPGLQATALEVLDEIVPATRGAIVALGLPLAHDGVLHNAACLAVDGKIAGFVAKQHLPGEGIHYEPRWFKPWPSGRQAEIRIGGQRYPLGDLLFDCGGVKIGFEICEDAWVASRPGRRLAQRGVDLILNPSASHFAFGKSRVREQFVLEGARAFSTSYVFANLVGNESGRAIYDGSTLVASGDRIVAAGPRFSFADVKLTTAIIDVDLTRMHRARGASYDPAAAAASEGTVGVEFEFPEQRPEPNSFAVAPWESGPHLKHEEFARSVSLALFDYLRKSYSRGFVVSLSGGADSATVASLCGMMVDFGVAELGCEAFLKKLAHIPKLDECTVPAVITRRLLTCVYQSTNNSSETTRSAARSAAAAIGAEFIDWSVDELVTGYVDTVSRAIGRPLSWENDDVALQNIQARARAPGVWLLANLRGALLLATSNRSEAAVGYTTMDGDTCGGLSPIAGIDKAYLRRWLAWAESTGPQGLKPLAGLKLVNAQTPTAELRPAEQGQTDEADLMPYDLLDAIERAAIRDKQTPVEVFERVRIEFPQHSPQQLVEWIERFFRLWCRNQWKRERYAPSFHLDDENLDPKTWCRFPILSGGYQRELAELRRHIS